VGRTASVLTRLGARGAAAVAVGALLVAFYVFHRRLPNLPTGWDVAFVGLLLIPAVFALVWFALPLHRARGLLGVGLAFAALAVVTETAELHMVANFAKLAAATAVAFWFLGYFENALWVGLVAVLIPWVDAYSVWRGPTKHIIDERPEVFSALSYSFPLPGERQILVTWRHPLSGEPDGYEVHRTPGGRRNDEPLRDQNADGEVGWPEAELDARRDYVYEVVAVEGTRRTSVTGVARWRDANDGVRHGSPSADRDAPTSMELDSVDSSAKLGLPDLLFFALFLGAADRFGLRRGLTWLLMTASFGLTLGGTYVFDVDGLPALPLLAIGFLLANADVLWRRLRARS
jgi:hypothetical protein